ncbi:MAG: aromatic ring-hydroxylating dioxygenase subunit alpha [Candidatus Eremiobacteraeota bacterium]|nr:aromatic ring-hydroxylating dioxygenase subunit alpha [Candidatus Eremiobacteraeota bacterium]MBV8366570.1 aromatic ring-hydroxylating dioxygenase subunit alpha [Candidatus Eremiobacteraeota bacterium]
MATFTRARLVASAHTLEGRYYTSPDVFKEEQTRIFSRGWVCVGREEQLPEAGSFFTAQVADESLIIVRDKSARLHAHFNVCRHRGTRICEAASGKFSGAIVCPYHAWTYGLDGTLMTARNMKDVPGFEESVYPLRAAALATWEGFIFVDISENPQPFANTFPALTDRFDRWHIGRLREGKRIDYDLACNWKLILQNYSECYHCPLVHPQLDKVSPWDSGRNDLSSGTVLGGYMSLRHGSETMTLSGGTTRKAFPELSAEDRERVYYYEIFPSMLLSLHPDYVMAHYLTPVTPQRTLVTCVWLFDPTEMTKPDFDGSDAVEFWDMTNRQDWHVCELSQLGVASRAYTPGPYAQAEGLLAAFDKNYMHIMEQS